MDNNIGYLIAAYAIIWLAIFGYCYRLSRRQEALRRRLAALRQEQRGPARTASAPAPSRASPGLSPSQ